MSRQHEWKEEHVTPDNPNSLASKVTQEIHINIEVTILGMRESWPSFNTTYIISL